MKIPDIKAIPVSKRFHFIYLERGVLEVDGFALVFAKGSELIHIPIGNTAALMLGPGVSVTHAAISLCAKEKSLLLWTGELGVRIYGACLPHYCQGYNVKRQVEYAYNLKDRLEVCKRLYRWMFDETVPNKRSVEQLRGWEGQKVKKIYQALSREHNVPWNGRQISYEVSDIDKINQSLEVANSCVYALAEAIIVALGYIPAIGFIHRGNQRSFVFDLADTIKIPVMTMIFSRYNDIKEPSADVRYMVRDYFAREKVSQRLITILDDVMAL